LHDTSSPNLFNRSQRDLSHGCVRVAEAEKLAEFVLSNQPETQWDLETIQQAMSGSKTRRVSLKNPIPVLFFYTTTFVDQDNQIHFYRDVYNQDAVLEKALGKIPLQDNSSVVTAKATTSG
jgi:murein L,D-transpeptidase YcbB/YkuD